MSESILLEPQFVLDTHLLTQIKRQDNNVIYKRETKEGSFVSYEVVSLEKDETGNEIYPSGESSKWFPMTMERAEYYFNKMCGIPMNESIENLSETPETVLTSEPVLVQDPETPPTSEPVETKSVVKVRRGRVAKTYTIPVGEFTQADFAVANSLTDTGIYQKLQREVTEGRVKVVGQRKGTGRGRPTSVYSAV